MTSTTKKIVLVSIGALLFAALIFGFRTDRGETGNVIKIGAVLPLSGTQAFVGEGMKNALEMALADLPATKHSYKLVIEDGAFDPKTSISAANKLIQIDKVDAIIDAYAPIGNAISPITEKEHVVHIDVAFDPKIADGDYNFILFTTPETAARSFFVEMKKRKLQTLGVFHVNNQGIAAVYAALRQHADEYGIKIVSDEMFQPGERDFKGIIAKGTSSRADVYALLALSPELEILAKQLYEQNIGNVSSTIYLELAKDKSVFEGKWSIGYGKVASDFETRYRSVYKRDLGFAAANAYDAFNIIVQAAESSIVKEKPTASFIAKQIQSIGTFDGVLGNLRVNNIGIIDTPTMVKVVKDGKMQAVE